MAFVGHPILADIRKGFRLRPTQTTDKSKPIIQAEGEQLPELLQKHSPSPAPPPQAKANGMPKTTTAPPMTQQKNEAKRQLQQAEMAKPSPPKSTGDQSVSADQRQKMLAQIRAGNVRLRHVQTMDKSGLILDEQQKLAIGTRNGTASPHSLDSQGKSPSPRTIPSSASASSVSAFSPTPISAGNGGGCWHRPLSGDSSASMPLSNVCVATAQLSHPPNYFGHHSAGLSPTHNHPTDQCSDHFRHSLHQLPPAVHSPHLFSADPSPPSPCAVSPSKMAVGRLPTPTPPAAQCKNQQGTTVIQVGETENANGGGNRQKGNSDFQFDERRQILERREEVASLCAQRSASAKIVAFRKLQQRHQQQTESAASSFCTLPRKTKAQQTQQKHWHPKVASSDGCSGAFPSAHCSVPTFALGKDERHGVNAQRAQSPTDWHDTKRGQTQTTTTKKTEEKQQQQQQRNYCFNGQQNANTLPNSKVRRHSPSPQRRIDAPPLLHRSVSSSLANVPIAEPSAASQPFRPFGQRVSVGGAHRQHFERIRDRFEDAEKRNGTEQSAEILWKRAAEERKGGGENGGKGKTETKGGVATVFVNGSHLGQGRPQKGQPPPLPSSSPPEIRQKTRQFAASPSSPGPPSEIIRLRTPTNGIDLRDLQNLDGAQLAVLRTDFKFAIDLDGNAEGKRLIRIVRR